MSVILTIQGQQAKFLELISEILDEWDEEDALGMEDSDPEILNKPPVLRTRVDLTTLSEAEWKDFFRFTKPEVDSLIVAMDIPDRVACNNGVSEPASIALPMLLRRLAYPARYKDIAHAFGWEKTRFSRVTRTLATYLYHRWSHILYFDPIRLTPTKLTDYASKVHAKGAALANVWGFVDGTLRRTARPVRNQRIIYNGWKRIHALKYHSVVTPDGLHAHLFGPIEGRRHDETVYQQSNLPHLLRQHSHTPDGTPLVIYGDPAYGLSQHLISPYKGADLSRSQMKFNATMSQVREAVEWGFGEVIKQFAFLDFHKNQKVLLQPVGIFYTVGVLFTNAHVILHGSQVSKFFQCPPPSLQEYFHGTVDDALEAKQRGYCVDFTQVVPGVQVAPEDVGEEESLD